ncbi:MAG: hypothetical protein COB60_01395 [Flavobacteriaceae bacterium]|nr:MAG: hypothetical protein COB60_01395 [Flavobacteriaceae bacterium]
MKKINQIKAWFFIGVIFLMTFLNAVPHLHHVHQEVAHNNLEVHHHHGDSDHHHPAPKKPVQVALDFSIDFLLQNHLHAIHSHEFIQLVKRNTRIVLKKQLAIQAIFGTQISLNVRRVKLPKTVDHYLNSYYKTPLIVNAPLRGPPQLG